MLHKTPYGLLMITVVAAGGCELQSHRVGQSATVDFGVVSNAREVTLGSDAPAGALVGGTLGLMMASSNSSSPRRARNAIVGAGIGAAVTGAAEGDRRGMSYTVDLLNGSSVTIITDQREIRVGDCVGVERVRDTANIRRASPAYCDRANTQAVSSVEDYVRSEATACEAAKQELVEANTQEAADLAASKVRLLCDS
jgi:outer membrane lipoprotein SlyB